MRSAEDFYKTFLGDPEDPNYAKRLNAYNLEHMAQAYRAMVIGEMVADAILWVARLPQRLVQALPRQRPGRAVMGWRAW